MILVNHRINSLNECKKICALLCAHKSEMDGTPFFLVFVGWGL